MILIALLVWAQSTYAAVSGNPVADGWTAHGHSLENGVYVRGNANYGFETYSATLTVDLAMAGTTGWSQGDTVIGVGGVIANITATDAGWASFTGATVNSLISPSTTGPRIQAKFGTFGPLDNTFTPNGSWGASTVAPGGGNAIGGLAGGHNGAIQVRGPRDSTYSSGNAGQLKPLNGIGGLDSSISRWTGSTSSTLSDISSARLIYNVDGNGELASWQILLNVTRLGSVSPFAYLPEAGVPALMTVQNNDSGYTDSLLFISSEEAAVPEPSSLAAWSLLALALGGTGWRRRRLASV